MKMKSIVDETLTGGGSVAERASRGMAPPAEISTMVEAAKQQLAGLTGLRPVAVSGVAHEEKGWCLHFDMLEMARIPPATDLIGEYVVHLREDGTLDRFERRRSRLRGDPRHEEEEI